jgi:hypothetical protein
MKGGKVMGPDGIPIEVEFCYSVTNQRESFICLDLLVKNRKVTIERYLSGE